MLGLIKKDLYLIMKNLSLVYLFTFAVVVVPLSQNSSMLLPMISFLVAIIFATQVATTMSLDEKSNWKKIVTAMPLLPQEIVGSKYVLTVILSAFSGVIVLVIGAIIALLIPNVSLNFKNILTYAGVCFCICALYNAIMIPATYKFGSSKSRMVLIIFVTLPTIVVAILRSLNINISLENFGSISIVKLLIFFVLLLIVVFGISFFISVRIQKKRD